MYIWWHCSPQNTPQALLCLQGSLLKSIGHQGQRPLKREMDPADFRGLYFYKLLIPAFTWGSILGTFLGPFLFPAAWFLFVAAFMVVFVLVSLSQVIYPPHGHQRASIIRSALEALSLMHSSV